MLEYYLLVLSLPSKGESATNDLFSLKKRKTRKRSEELEK